MSESPLMIKSKAFALEVISACKVLREAKCESALISQFLRWGRALARIFVRYFMLTARRISLRNYILPSRNALKRNIGLSF